MIDLDPYIAVGAIILIAGLVAGWNIGYGRGYTQGVNDAASRMSGAVRGIATRKRE
jgi:hypothetical protein